MTATINLTDEQIRARGIEALHRELGPSGVIRFLKQFERGRGDYSKERHAWVGAEPVAALTEEIRKRRRARR